MAEMTDRLMAASSMLDFQMARSLKKVYLLEPWMEHRLESMKSKAHPWVLTRGQARLKDTDLENQRRWAL